MSPGIIPGMMPGAEPPLALRPRPAHRHRRLLRVVLAILLVPFLAWSAGLVWFVHATFTPCESPPRTDGIVVLTGGAGRIETALQLLAQDQARLLLVSGVSRNTALAELAYLAGIAPEPLAARITLGRDAQTTQGNAAETAIWVQANDLHSLIVVTAAYHMPRAMTELGRALPSVRLYPSAVLPPALRTPGRLGTMRLLATEYTKWLLVRLWLAHLSQWPGSSPTRAAGLNAAPAPTAPTP